MNHLIKSLQFLLSFDVDELIWKILDMRNDVEYRQEFQSDISSFFSNHLQPILNHNNHKIKKNILDQENDRNLLFYENQFLTFIKITKPTNS